MIQVIDDFMPCPQKTRSDGLSADYIDWPGFDGEVYKRVCLTDIEGLQDGIEKAMGRPVQMLGMGYRLNFNKELPNAAIHSDVGWGTHALVLFLNEQGEGGTAFWKHKASGATKIYHDDAELIEQVKDDWNNPEAWEMHQLVEMKFNRALIYESAYFHSRYPFEAFGTGFDDGRLIAVAFFS